MLSSVPAFAKIPQIGIELALARRSQSGARSTFGEGICGEKSLDNAPTHLQRTSDRSLSHSRSVQSQDLLIASRALVAADLLLAFRVGQAGKLHLPTHQLLWQLWLNRLQRLISSLCLRTTRRDVTRHCVHLIIHSTSEALIAGGHGLERDILDRW